MMMHFLSDIQNSRSRLILSMGCRKTPPPPQRVLVTPWWTCGCRSEAQRVAGPRRPPPPLPRCRCPRGWAAVWYGPRSSDGCPGGWGPWLHPHLKTGKTHHPPHSDWRCGSHQKWADWPSPSVLLCSRSGRGSTMSVRGKRRWCLITHAQKMSSTLNCNSWRRKYLFTQHGTLSGRQWYLNSITGTSRMRRLSQI